VDIRRQAKAAQMRYRPEPTETLMPSGTEAFSNEREFTDSAFFIKAVQIDAPTRRNIVPMIAKLVDTRKATVCFTRPLSGHRYSYSMLWESEERKY